MTDKISELGESYHQVINDLMRQKELYAFKIVEVEKALMALRKIMAADDDGK